jgi:hypothetical protein
MNSVQHSLFGRQSQSRSNFSFCSVAEKKVVFTASIDIRLTNSMIMSYSILIISVLFRYSLSEERFKNAKDQTHNLWCDIYNFEEVSLSRPPRLIKPCLLLKRGIYFFYNINKTNRTMPVLKYVILIIILL